MPRLTLSLLGAFHAELDGQPVIGYKSNKVRALLAYLAVEASRPHRRESLATLLWPDAPDTIALSNLRNALADLRQLLHDRDADTPILLISHESIQLNPDADIWVDVWEFEQGPGDREQGLGGRGQGARSDAIAISMLNLQSAIALYRGPFLEGFSIPDSAPFEEWVTLKREQLGQRAIHILRQLADFHEACGEYEQRAASPSARWSWSPGWRKPTASSCASVRFPVSAAQPWRNTKPASACWRTSWASSQRMRRHGCTRLFLMVGKMKSAARRCCRHRGTTFQRPAVLR